MNACLWSLGTEPVFTLRPLQPETLGTGTDKERKASLRWAGTTRGSPVAHHEHSNADPLQVFHPQPHASCILLLPIPHPRR